MNGHTADSQRVGRKMKFRQMTAVLFFIGTCALVWAEEATRADGARRTLARNDTYSVVWIEHSDLRMELEVLDSKKTVLWNTQPSSSEILVALDASRILIFTKIRNEGYMDFDRAWPVSGAGLFSLEGEKIGQIPGSIYAGHIFKTLFVGNKTGGGVVAYDIRTAKRAWEYAGVRADTLDLCGSSVLCARSSDDQRQESTCHLLSLDQGQLLFELSCPRDEYLKVLAASAKICVFARRTRTDGGGIAWISEVLDRNSKTVAEIRWKSIPVKGDVVVDGSSFRISPAKEKTASVKWSETKNR